jgi:hypothetical protein
MHQELFYDHLNNTEKKYQIWNLFQLTPASPTGWARPFILLKDSTELVYIALIGR